MHDGDRTVRQGHHLLCDATEQQAGQPSVPATAESIRVGLPGVRAGEDLLCRIPNEDISRDVRCALGRRPVTDLGEPLAQRLDCEGGRRFRVCSIRA